MMSVMSAILFLLSLLLMTVDILTDLMTGVRYFYADNWCTDPVFGYLTLSLSFLAPGIVTGLAEITVIDNTAVKIIRVVCCVLFFPILCIGYTIAGYLKPERFTKERIRMRTNLTHFQSALQLILQLYIALRTGVNSTPDTVGQPHEYILILITISTSALSVIFGPLCTGLLTESVVRSCVGGAMVVCKVVAGYLPMAVLSGVFHYSCMMVHMSGSYTGTEDVPWQYRYFLPICAILIQVGTHMIVYWTCSWRQVCKVDSYTKTWTYRMRGFCQSLLYGFKRLLSAVVLDQPRTMVISTLASFTTNTVFMAIAMYLYHYYGNMMYYVWLWPVLKPFGTYLNQVLWVGLFVAPGLLHLIMTLLHAKFHWGLFSKAAQKNVPERIVPNTDSKTVNYERQKDADSNISATDAKTSAVQAITTSSMSKEIESTANTNVGPDSNINISDSDYNISVADIDNIFRDAGIDFGKDSTRTLVSSSKTSIIKNKTDNDDCVIVIKKVDDNNKDNDDCVIVIKKVDDNNNDTKHTYTCQNEAFIVDNDSNLADDSNMIIESNSSIDQGVHVAAINKSAVFGNDITSDSKNTGYKITQVTRLQEVARTNFTKNKNVSGIPRNIAHSVAKQGVTDSGSKATYNNVVSVESNESLNDITNNWRIDTNMDSIAKLIAANKVVPTNNNFVVVLSADNKVLAAYNKDTEKDNKSTNTKVKHSVDTKPNTPVKSPMPKDNIANDFVNLHRILFDSTRKNNLPLETSYQAKL